MSATIWKEAAQAAWHKEQERRAAEEAQRAERERIYEQQQAQEQSQKQAALLSQFGLSLTILLQTPVSPDALEFSCDGLTFSYLPNKHGETCLRLKTLCPDCRKSYHAPVRSLAEMGQLLENPLLGHDCQGLPSPPAPVLDPDWKQNLAEQYRQQRAEIARLEAEQQERQRQEQLERFGERLQELGIPVEPVSLRLTIEGITFEWSGSSLWIVEPCSACGEALKYGSIRDRGSLARYLAGDWSEGPFYDHRCPANIPPRVSTHEMELPPSQETQLLNLFRELVREIVQNERVYD